MMVVLVMKTTFPKLKLRIVQYRDYTQFSNNNLRKKCLVNLSLENINNNIKFLQICITALAQIAPREKNNNMPFCNKELSSTNKQEGN